MADNKLELVIEVDANRGNASIKSFNTGLSSIEQTAAKSAKGASQGIDGMTASMVKGATAGVLLADAIKTAVTWAKSWTIEAVKMAAHEIRLEASGRALAKAHGIAAGAFEKAVEAVRKIGYHGEDAIHTIDRLIIADIDLSKGVGLAKIAKDAAAIENIEAPEALEKILRAIEFGNARALRSAGLRVDFEREIEIAELQLGKTLSENEKVQIRYNAVMRVAAAIQGAHAGAAGEAETQMKALGRELHELREAVGAHFQEQFKWLLGTLRDLVGWLKENTDLLVKFGQATIFVAAAIATYGLITKIAGITHAVQGLALALTAHPIALLLTGVLAAGAIVYKTWSDTQEQLEARAKEQERKTQREQLLSGRTSLADLRKQGKTDEQIRELVAGRRALPGEEFTFEGGRKVTIETGPDINALKRAQEIRKKQAEAERQTYESARAAEAHAAGGAGKIVLEMQKQIAKYTSFVDERGVVHAMQLTVKTRENLERELHVKIRDLQREDAAEHIKLLREGYEQRLAWETGRFQRGLEFENETGQMVIETADKRFAIEQEEVARERDARLQTLQLVGAQTLEQKIAVDRQRVEIEVEAIGKIEALQIEEINRRKEREIEYLAWLRVARPEMVSELDARIRAVEDSRRQEVEAAQGKAIADENRVRLDGAVQTANLVRDEQRRIFDSLKQQAGGVFDALLTKSQSIWSAIANSLKVAILTAIKEIVTSRVAAMLMQLFTGQKVSFASGGAGGGGALGRLGGILGIGAVPVFGGGGGGFGGGGAVPGLGGFGIPGAPGGTGGFAGPVSMGGSPASGGAPWGNLGAMGGNYLAGLKSFAGIGGSVQTGAGMATTWQAATMGQKLSAIGKSDAALMGGAMLGMEGLRRGGASGLAMTTAGGAMIGYKFGGPIGAAIGAGIGAIAGTIRLFVKGAQEKAREKIKAAYGVDVSDKGILKQIVDMAKQAFGGNLDVAIRSPQIRELIELYAQTTGQKSGGIVDRMRPLEMVQSGGQLSGIPAYNQAAALATETRMALADEVGRTISRQSFGGEGLTQKLAGKMRSAVFQGLEGGSLSLPGPPAPAPTAPTIINFTMPPEAVNDAFDGRTQRFVVANPRTIQTASREATRGNYGRREMAATLMSPSTILS